MAGVPTPEPTLGLAGAIAVDTLMTLPMGSAVVHGVGRSLPPRSSAELDEAVAFYDRAGWSATTRSVTRLRQTVPAGTVAPLAAGSTSSPSTVAGTPSTGSPVANDGDRSPPTGPCRFGLMRHPADRGPGSSPSTARAWDGCATTNAPRRRLHEELGVNIALPVLPLHGPASRRFRPGSDVRVERLPGEQRARSDAIDLGRSPTAVVAPRRTGRDVGRRARPLARLVRVQPPVDTRGRPGLRDRARPAGRSGRRRCGQPSPPCRRNAGCTRRSSTSGPRSSCGRSRHSPAPASCRRSDGSSWPDRSTASPRRRVPPHCGGTGTSRRSCGGHAATSPPAGRPSTTTTSRPYSCRVASPPRRRSRTESTAGIGESMRQLSTSDWTMVAIDSPHAHNTIGLVGIYDTSTCTDGPPDYDEVLALHRGSPARRRELPGTDPERAVRPRPAVLGPRRQLRSRVPRSRDRPATAGQLAPVLHTDRPHPCPPARPQPTALGALPHRRARRHRPRARRVRSRCSCASTTRRSTASPAPRSSPRSTPTSPTPRHRRRPRATSGSRIRFRATPSCCSSRRSTG